MLLKICSFIFFGLLLVSNAGASANVFREECLEHDLSWIETPEERAEYAKDCAPRHGEVGKFWQVMAEYRKQRSITVRAWEDARKHPEDRRRELQSETASLNLLTARDLIGRVYRDLYELERRQVFNAEGSKKIRSLIEGDGRRLGRLTPRQAFARRFIHGNRFDERDGLSALSEEAHEQNWAYVAKLRKRGLPAKSP